MNINCNKMLHIMVHMFMLFFFLINFCGCANYRAFLAYDSNYYKYHNTLLKSGTSSYNEFMSLYSEYNKSVSVDLFKVKKPDAIFPVKSYSVYFIWTNPQKCILTQFSTFKEVVDVPIVVKDYINVENKKPNMGERLPRKRFTRLKKSKNGKN